MNVFAYIGHRKKIVKISNNNAVRAVTTLALGNGRPGLRLLATDFFPYDLFLPAANLIQNDDAEAPAQGKPGDVRLAKWNNQKSPLQRARSAARIAAKLKKQLRYAALTPGGDISDPA